MATIGKWFDAEHQQPKSIDKRIIFGVPKFFIPRWFRPIIDINEFPQDWTYLYDNTPLAKTIEKYVDFKKLSPGSLFADAR